MQQQLRSQQSAADAASTYDSATVREILGRASEIEAQQKEEALTAAQIESLGRELGMSPRAVRQALQERIGGAGTNTVPSTGYTSQSITGQDIRTASKTGAIYSVIAFLLIVLANIANRRADTGLATPIALLVVLAYYVLGPFALPFYYGWKRRDGRQGALMGAMLVPMYLVSITAGVAVSRWFAHNGQYAEIGLFVALALFAIPSGLLGGTIGRWRHRRKVARER